LTLVQDLGIKPSRRTRTERTLSRLREFSSTVTLWTFCVGAKLSFPFECNVHSGRGSSTSMKRHHFNALQNVVLLVISLAPMSKHINNNTDTTRSYKFTKDATRTLNTCMSFGAKLQMLESMLRDGPVCICLGLGLGLKRSQVQSVQTHQNYRQRHEHYILHKARNMHLQPVVPIARR
jgi:hypothetical protein